MTAQRKRGCTIRAVDHERAKDAYIAAVCRAQRALSTSIHLDPWIAAHRCSELERTLARRIDVAREMTGPAHDDALAASWHTWRTQHTQRTRRTAGICATAIAIGGSLAGKKTAVAAAIGTHALWRTQRHIGPRTLAAWLSWRDNDIYAILDTGRVLQRASLDTIDSSAWFNPDLRPLVYGKIAASHPGILPDVLGALCGPGTTLADSFAAYQALCGCALCRCAVT